jgi:hypothetical protein
MGKAQAGFGGTLVAVPGVEQVVHDWRWIFRIPARLCRTESRIV